MCFCFPHWKEVAVCIKELPGSTLSLWWWLSLRILKKIIGQLFGIPIHQELSAEIKTRPCLVSANILVTPVLSRPTWHCSQETAPGSRLCLGGTGPGSVHRKRHPPTFALLKRTQFMDNKVSANLSFFFCCLIIVSVSVQFSLQWGGGVGGLGLQSQHLREQGRIWHREEVVGERQVERFWCRRHSLASQTAAVTDETKLCRECQRVYCACKQACIAAGRVLKLLLFFYCHTD